MAVRTRTVENQDWLTTTIKLNLVSPRKIQKLGVSACSTGDIILRKNQNVHFNSWVIQLRNVARATQIWCTQIGCFSIVVLKLYSRSFQRGLLLIKINQK